MCCVKSRFVIFMLSVGSLSFAQEANAAKCSSAPDIAAYHRCVSKCPSQDMNSYRECQDLDSFAPRMSAKMSNAEKQVRAAVIAWSGEKASKDEALHSLDVATNAFQAYRENTCNLESSSMNGGNGSGGVYLECIARMADERTKSLREQAKLFR